jgi:Gpi18-like mannosyltransferase
MNTFLGKLTKLKPQTYDLILLFLIATAMRLWYALNNFWMAGDSLDYVDLAKNLHLFNSFAFTEGNSLIPTPNQDNGLMLTAFRPLLYPLMAALVWTGDSFPYNTVLFIQAFMGAATVVLTYLIARHYFERSVAIFSALLLTFSPLVIIFTATILTETLFTFLTVLGCFLLIKKKTIPSGIALGLAFLTRPVILPFLLLLTISSLFSSTTRKLTIYYTTVLLLTVLVATPWIIRNSLLFNRIVLTQSSGYGTNLEAVS